MSNFNKTESVLMVKSYTQRVLGVQPESNTLNTEKVFPNMGILHYCLHVEHPGWFHSPWSFPV